MKPRLIMLHGFTGSGQVFDHLRDGLSDVAEVATPDHPWDGLRGGHIHGSRGGHIHGSRGGHIHGSRGGHIHGSRGGHMGPPLLHGYSMGGRYALRLALDNPGLYSALILESTHPGIESESERADRRRRDAELAAWIRRDYAGFLEAWNRLPLFASPSDAPAELAQAFRNIQRTRDPETLACCLETFGAGDILPMRDRLGDLTMPVLAITGSLDSSYCSLWADITREHPNIRHEVVPEAGHRVHLDRPDLYLSILKSFILDIIRP